MRATTSCPLQMATTNRIPRRTGNSESQFPGKLHDMLDYVEQHRLEYIVSWVENGRAFRVHDQERLVELLPLFFSQSKYRSFARQLNMWHFERIVDEGNKNTFVHPFFIRGQKALCSKMSRHVKLPLSKDFYLRLCKSNNNGIVSEPTKPWSRNLASRASSFRSEMFSKHTILPSPSLPMTLSMALESILSSSVVQDLAESKVSNTPDVFSDIEQAIGPFDEESNNSSEFEDGDVALFAGRRFHFVDILQDNF